MISDLSKYKLWGLCYFMLLFPLNIWAQCNLTATTTGFNAAFTHVYVLVDANGNIVEQNGTGNFVAPTNGVYNIHALNYDPADPPDPLPAALIGQPITNVGATNAGCFNDDFLTDFVEKTCATCSLSATTSGSNPAFTQVYVLVDELGNIVAQNNTGTFASVGAGTFFIHALNYDPVNPPAPLPSALIGQPVGNVGSTTTGCFNSDFLTDFVEKTCSTCFQERSICVTDPFIVSSPGMNAAFTQTYVLEDRTTGLIVATNLTGDFSGAIAIGTDYRVYALNCDPTNLPNPMPTVGGFVEAVGTTSEGCYNTNFKTDYLCYTITNCILPIDLISFTAKCTNGVVNVKWATSAEKNNDFFTIEQSTNGKNWREIAKVASKASNSATKIFYEFVDREPAIGTAYYRLKQTDFDGKFNYSKSVAVKCEDISEQIKIFPNPTTGIITIEGVEIDAQIKILNPIGQEIETFDAQENTFQVDLSRYANGIYYLFIKQNDKNTVNKVILQK